MTNWLKIEVELGIKANALMLVANKFMNSNPVVPELSGEFAKLRNEYSVYIHAIGLSDIVLVHHMSGRDCYYCKMGYYSSCPVKSEPPTAAVLAWHLEVDSQIYKNWYYPRLNNELWSTLETLCLLQRYQEAVSNLGSIEQPTERYKALIRSCAGKFNWKCRD